MNAKRGCLRIVLVLVLLSACTGFLRLVMSVNDAQAEAGLLLMIGGPVVILLVSLVVWWIVKGFTASS